MTTNEWIVRRLRCARLGSDAWFSSHQQYMPSAQNAIAPVAVTI